MLTDTRELWSWGFNKFGQLGNSEGTNEDAPIPQRSNSHLLQLSVQEESPPYGKQCSGEKELRVFCGMWNTFLYIKGRSTVT